MGATRLFRLGDEDDADVSERRCTTRPGPPNTPCRCSGFVRKRRCYPCSHCPAWTRRAQAHCSAPLGGWGQAHFLAFPEAAAGRLASVGDVRPEPPKFRGPRCPGRPHLFRDRSRLPSGQPPRPLNDQSLSRQCCPENGEWTHASKNRKFRQWAHRKNQGDVTLPGPADDLLPTSSLRQARPTP
jgi:hypothetical protein